MRFLALLFLLPMLGCAAWPDLVDVRSTTVKVSDNGGHGSGTIISKDMILTAAHVVRGGELFDIQFYDGHTAVAAVQWIDTASDMAFLKLEKPEKYAAVIDCRPLQIGDRVFTMGNPGILMFVLTEGIVAGSEPLGAQKAMLPPNMPVEIEPTLIVSADWEPGDSGAGVFDLKGRVRGIVLGGTESNNGIITPVTVLPMCRGKAA